MSWLESPLLSDALSAVVASSNPAFRRQLLDLLRSSQCSVEEAEGGADALAKIEAGRCRILLLDRWLPDLDAGELVSTIRHRHPQVEVVVVDSQGAVPVGSAPATGHIEELLEQLRSARRGLRGTETNPSGGTPADSALPLDKAASSRFAAHPLARFSSESQPGARTAEPLPGMIGSSKAMQRVYRLARLVAPRPTTVLVTGETGTGKELVARAIHLLGPRSRQPFIAVNCAAIPETLLEAELFGYARGAFTGAFQSRLGRIHAAHGGTLFLDEVGELPLSMQAKLLRFLQEGEVQRLGGSDIIRVDVRVIAATNADLSRRVAEKVFREDLYYRISVFPIDILPLRKRVQDILPLGVAFLAELCAEARTPPKAISPAAGKLLEQHRWLGNVRELRHVMERAFILSEDAQEIGPEHICLQTPWK